MAAQDLCTLSDVRQGLEIPAADTSRDALISALITQASEAIINEASREFAPATASATRRFRVDSFTVNLEPYDLRTATTVVLHPESPSPQTLTATSDYQLLPIGAPSSTFTSLALSNLLATITAGLTPFAFGYAQLDITGAWGFATVPDDVKRAAVLTVGAWLRKDVSAMLAAADLEGGRALTPGMPTAFDIPQSARSLLGPFYRLRTWVC